MQNSMFSSGEIWKKTLRAALHEDGAEWDWTTVGVLNGKKQVARARIISKSDGIWCGESLGQAVQSLSEDFGSKIRVKAHFSDGQRIRPKNLLAEWTGDPQIILALERPYLNLASYCSGIATATRALVDGLHPSKFNPKPRITATRKTLPGYRDLAIYSVLMGGGKSHRQNLSGGVLIKENHIALAGGIRKAVNRVRETAPHGLKIEAEVTSLSECSSLG